MPFAPTLLTGLLQSGPQVGLAWQDNAIDETGFVVERAIGVGGFIPIATPAGRNNTGNVTSVDTTVQAATSYQYRVKAVNGGGSSAYSPVVIVTVPSVPAAPSALAGSAVRGNGTTTSLLTWTDNASDETGFTIQRDTSPDVRGGHDVHGGGRLDRLDTERPAEHYILLPDRGYQPGRLLRLVGRHQPDAHVGRGTVAGADREAGAGASAEARRPIAARAV